MHALKSYKIIIKLLKTIKKDTKLVFKRVLYKTCEVCAGFVEYFKHET